MIDILRRLRRIALRKAKQEFERYNETWNQPYPLLGSGVAFGVLGAALCLVITTVILVILEWQFHNEKDFWLNAVAVGFAYGAIPGFALGGISGLAQAFVWTRRSGLAGLICLAGGTAVMVRMAYLCAEILSQIPEIGLFFLVMLFSASFAWSALLLVCGLRLLCAKK